MNHSEVFCMTSWGDNEHPERFREWFKDLTGFKLAEKHFSRGDKDEEVSFSIAVRVSRRPEAVKIDKDNRRFRSKSGAGSIFVSLIGTWNEEQVAEEDLGAKYLGTSLVFFPCYRQVDDETRKSREKTYDALPCGLIVCMGMGTGGAGPDEAIIRNPGHMRRFGGMIASLGDIPESIPLWWRCAPHERKPVPDSFIRRARDIMHAEPYALLPRDEAGGYGQYLYAVAVLVFTEQGNLNDEAIGLLNGFAEFYLRERGWRQGKHNDPAWKWYSKLYPCVSKEDVNNLLMKHRFLIVCGPPGTRKTEYLKEIAGGYFNNRCIQIQFHPSVTYQSFVGGIQPTISTNSDSDAVGFEFSTGPFLRSIESARDASEKSGFLLAVDEINRADLGTVLGEAIQLLEPNARYGIQIKDYNGGAEVKMPDNLFLLATMNTADRTIAQLDVAIRRRFAFVTTWPEEPKGEIACDKGRELFKRCRDLFLEYGEDSDLGLMPGGYYFLGASATELRETVQHRLLPLLEDYLQENRLSSTLQSELALWVQELHRVYS